MLWHLHMMLLPIPLQDISHNSLCLAGRHKHLVTNGWGYPHMIPHILCSWLQEHTKLFQAEKQGSLKGI